MPRNPSQITESLSVDKPLNQNANYRFNADDRQYLDNQVRGIEQHLVDALIRERHATYVTANMTLAAGFAVCGAGIDSTEPQVTLATSAALTNAGIVLGIVLRPIASGGKALVCMGGVLPSSLTNLAKDNPGYVRVNTTTGALERVVTLGSSDYGVGFVDPAGYMTVVPGITVPGAAATGDEANSLTITATPGSALVMTGYGHLDSASAGSAVVIAGISAPSAGKAKRFTVTNNNASSATLTLKHNDGSVSAANRFSLAGAADLVINSGETYVVSYSQSTARWMATKAGGGTLSVPTPDNGVLARATSSSVRTSAKVFINATDSQLEVGNPWVSFSPATQGDVRFCAESSMYTRGELTAKDIPITWQFSDNSADLPQERMLIGWDGWQDSLIYAGGTAHVPETTGAFDQITLSASQFVNNQCGWIWDLGEGGSFFNLVSWNGVFSGTGKTARMAQIYPNIYLTANYADSALSADPFTGGLGYFFVEDRRTAHTAAIRSSGFGLWARPSDHHPMVTIGNTDYDLLAGGGSGEANTASNIGSGVGVFDSKSGVDLRFRKILAGSNVTVNLVGSDIVIASTGGGGGGSAAGTAGKIQGSNGSGGFTAPGPELGAGYINIGITGAPGVNGLAMSNGSGVYIRDNGGTLRNVASYDSSNNMFFGTSTGSGGSTTIDTPSGTTINLRVAGSTRFFVGGSLAQSNVPVEVAGGTGYVGVFGGGIMPSSGMFRAASGGVSGAPLLSWTDSGGVTHKAISHAASNDLTIGDNTVVNVLSSFTTLWAGGQQVATINNGSFAFTPAGTGALTVTNTGVHPLQPVKFGPVGSTFASVGLERHVNNPGVISAQRNSGVGGGTADQVHLAASANNLFVGSNTSGGAQFSQTYVSGSATVGMEAGSTGVADIGFDNNLGYLKKPLVGNVSPYSVHGQASISITATRALTPAEYQMAIWSFVATSGPKTVTVPAAGSGAGAYWKFFSVAGASVELTITTGSGATATISTAIAKGVLLVTPAGVAVFQMS